MSIEEIKDVKELEDYFKLIKIRLDRFCNKYDLEAIDILNYCNCLIKKFIDKERFLKALRNFVIRTTKQNLMNKIERSEKK